MRKTMKKSIKHGKTIHSRHEYEKKMNPMPTRFRYQRKSMRTSKPQQQQ